VSLIRIDWNPDARALRRFGVAMLLGFAILGYLFHADWAFGLPTVAWVCWGLGAALGLPALTGHPISRPGYRLWMGFAFVIGNVVSRVILLLIWFGPVTMTALVMKAVRRDRLRRRKPDADSYWVDMPPPPAEKERWERQY